MIILPSLSCLSVRKGPTITRSVCMFRSIITKRNMRNQPGWFLLALEIVTKGIFISGICLIFLMFPRLEKVSPVKIIWFPPNWRWTLADDKKNSKEQVIFHFCHKVILTTHMSQKYWVTDEVKTSDLVNICHS